MTMTGRERFERFWQALPPTDQAALARDYARRAYEDGAYVVLADGQKVPIPPIVTPVVSDPEKARRASADAHLITRALCRLTVDLMGDSTKEPLRARLFGAFTPLETAALTSGWRNAEQLATVRVDFLLDRGGQARALEVNATIPAMQGYSDAIAAAFIGAVGQARRLSAAAVAALIDANGRNSDDLLASLLAHHERLGGAVRAQTIAIVARAGDAQEGELSHYVRRWTALGHRAFLATPDEVRIEGGEAIVAGVRPDLIYRHIFARRLDPQSHFARLCLAPEAFHLFNPISSHLEVKGMLGLLSAAAVDDREAKRIGLLDEEREAVLRAVPWTRLLSPGPAVGPTGEHIVDLPAWVKGSGPRLVLKRSWDYGGKGVFLGNELDGSAQKRAQALVGGGAIDWAGLCEFALADRDAWVVQELVDAAPEGLLRLGPEGIARRELYVDLSAFTNVGTAPRPSGGAVRAAESRIVNILGGGGLAPLLRAEVFERLLG